MTCECAEDSSPGLDNEKAPGLKPLPQKVCMHEAL